MQYNINAFIKSNKQIQKKAKLFRQSVQLIERQVLSTDLRGYKGEFLIWSWGLKNKVFLSMNLWLTLALQATQKVVLFLIRNVCLCLFDSEYVLVFAACSLPSRENQVKKLIHWGPL